MQVSRCWTDADGFQLRIRKAFCPLDGVPKDLEVRTQPQAAWCAWAEAASEIEQADLLASCGKAEICLGHNPTAVAIGYFHAQRLRMNLLPLTNRYVDRRVSWVHPAFGN